MTTILALDTSTDACSVALQAGERVDSRIEFIPRQHNRLLFRLIDDVVGSRSLAEAGVDALAWNHGPGSFTGLRIAASAAQGLAFASGLPVAGVSTLACMAQGAWRSGLADPGAALLVLLDARINELYWGVYRLRNGLAEALCEDAVSSPDAVVLPAAAGELPLSAVGNGYRYAASFPRRLAERLAGTPEAVLEHWPDSRDILPLAAAALEAGRGVSAESVQPVYLRNEINWKKLPEQGRRVRPGAPATSAGMPGGPGKT